jgi:tetratricopeptide (TPR) repeat protein
MDAAQQVDEKEAPALYQADAAVREALVGNADLAKQQAHAALAISNSRDAESLSAFALALAGDSPSALRLADDLGKRFPQDTIVQSTYLPAIHAAELLVRKDPGKAIDVLAGPAPRELGGNIENVNFVLYLIYLRGNSYIASRQGAAAVAEFQKIIDHPGVARSEPIGALAHLQIGRAFALAGDMARARAAYQEFLSLWKEADPDIPIFKQAIAEFSRLE